MDATIVRPEHIVLIAVITRPLDLVIAREQHWYRLPAREAERLPCPDIVAFYQTAAFGPERWSVRTIAPVRGHELVRRRELLPDEAGHPRAGQRYLKLQLGPLVALPRPLVSPRWHRLTFLLTTGARLLAARDVPALVPDPAERELLWRPDEPLPPLR
jgi:hypothetical protein